MKTVLISTAIALASTTVAMAGTVEQNCWKKITIIMVENGCTFGNDLSPASNRCEHIRRVSYNKCVFHARLKQQIGPVHQVEIDRPVLRLPN